LSSAVPVAHGKGLPCNVIRQGQPWQVGHCNLWHQAHEKGRYTLTQRIELPQALLYDPSMAASSWVVFRRTGSFWAQVGTNCGSGMGTDSGEISTVLMSWLFAHIQADHEAALLLKVEGHQAAVRTHHINIQVSPALVTLAWSTRTAGLPDCWSRGAESAGNLLIHLPPGKLPVCSLCAVRTVFIATEQALVVWYVRIRMPLLFWKAAGVSS
jgi:hypothetical protein